MPAVPVFMRIGLTHFLATKEHRVSLNVFVSHINDKVSKQEKDSLIIKSPVLTHLLIPSPRPDTLTIATAIAPIFPRKTAELVTSSYDNPTDMLQIASTTVATVTELPLSPDAILQTRLDSDTHSVAESPLAPPRTCPLYLRSQYVRKVNVYQN